MVVIDPNSKAAREAEARVLARREAWNAHLAKLNAERRQELRDRFAMAALTGLLASGGGSIDLDRDELADEAWAQADAMMKIRDAGKDEK